MCVVLVSFPWRGHRALIPLWRTQQALPQPDPVVAGPALWFLWSQNVPQPQPSGRFEKSGFKLHLSWQVPSMLSGHTTGLPQVGGERRTGHSWGSAFIRVQGGVSGSVDWLFKNMRIGIGCRREKLESLKGSVIWVPFHVIEGEMMGRRGLASYLVVLLVDMSQSLPHVCSRWRPLKWTSQNQKLNVRHLHCNLSLKF